MSIRGAWTGIFRSGLEFAYSNDVVGEASSLKSKWGIFWKRLGGIGKYVLERILELLQCLLDCICIRVAKFVVQ